MATINVTPLIDVLLVLLIIFMVIVPAHSVGLPARAPQQDGIATAPADERAIVITVLSGSTVMLNRETLSAANWPERLRHILAGRADRTVFLTAAPDMEFREVAEAIDAARAAGASQTGLLSYSSSQRRIPSFISSKAR